MSRGRDPWTRRSPPEGAKVAYAQDLSKTPIVEVTDKYVLSDGAREVQAYAPLPAQLNPNLAALVAGVKKYGFTPEKFAGGHGSNADYVPLAALEGK